MDTHSFKLSGVPTTITYIGGKQQAILTKNTSVPPTEKLYDIAKSLTISIGGFVLAEHSEAEVDKFFEQMLSAHVKQILTEARQFTYDDEEFVFAFEATVVEDGKQVKKSKEMGVPLENGFPVTPVKVFSMEMLKGIKTLSQLRALDGKLIPLEVGNYEQVVENSIMEFILPKSGKHMQMAMRNGKSGKIIGAIKQKDIDSNAAILSAQPKFLLEEGSEGKNWINYGVSEINKAHAVDLEYMRLILKLWEGSVDTELEFDNPFVDGKKEYTDLLSQPSFFFLSGGI